MATITADKEQAMNTYRIMCTQSRKDENGVIRFFESEIGREQAKNAGHAIRNFWAKAIDAGIATEKTFATFTGTQVAVLGVGTFKARKVS